MQTTRTCFPSQPTFLNLNFEAATILPIQGGFHEIDLTPAFPGWTAYVGGSPLNVALYDDLFLDSAGISILDTNAVLSGLIEGHFTALLQAGISLTTGQPAQTALAQTGFIPPGTESLLFKADPRGLFNVMLGGELLALNSLGNGGNYTLFGADIHQFAGQTAELRFTAGSDNPLANHSFLFLDGIQFSTQTVPEPRISSLIACAILIFGFRFRRVVLSWFVSGKQ